MKLIVMNFIVPYLIYRSSWSHGSSKLGICLSVCLLILTHLTSINELKTESVRRQKKLLSVAQGKVIKF